VLLAGAALLVLAPASLAASTWAGTGSLHRPRVSPATTLLADGRVFVVGGQQGGAASAELYDPRTGAWKLVPDVPVGFDQPAQAFLLGNSRVLLLAPASRFNAGRQPPTVASFDADLGWLPVADPPGVGGDNFQAAAADADDVLVAGGNGLGGPVADAALYSARAGAWIPLAPMSTPRSGGRAAALGNGAVLVAGGYGFGGPDAAPLDSAEVFTGQTGWHSAASYPGLAGVYQLLSLGPGRALALIAGASPGLAVFDLTANRWTAAATPPQPLPGPGVLLPDGRVLFAGGNSQPSANADLYDPVRDSWSSLQPLAESRARPAVAVLPNGGVLVAGGAGASGRLSSAEVFGGPPRPAGQAGGPSEAIPQSGWIATGLVLLLGGMAVFLGLGRSRRPSRLALGLGRLALQAGGVIVATWGLFYLAHLLVNARGPGGAIPNFFYQPLSQVLWEGALRSLTLVGFAVAGATAVGLGAAIAVVSLRERRLVGVELAGAVMFVIPTFLLAILVQELQAFVFGKTGLIVAAGYGDVNAVQIFWASLVLGIRPATYLYRHARAVLDREAGEDYVRTAEAKGVEWSGVVRHHLLRAGGSALVATWSNSFRLMIGSLPLVEYFFGYPGLGRILVQAIGIHYGVGTDFPRPTVIRGDIAIGLVVLLALILILAETAAGGLQRWLDPRLRAVRAAA
jgi:ABC-type dipeptide/oligopeptide/nickel transport system permease component